MARKSAPLYNWQIEVQEGEQKSKKVFLEKYSKEIGYSERYIYDDEISDLKDKYDISENILLDIIEESNKLFINKQETILFNRFTDFLKEHDDFITNSDREKIKLKYNYDFHDFYNSLKFESLISKFNQDLLIKKEEKIFNDLKKKLVSNNKYVSKSDRKKYISDFKLNYSNSINTVKINNCIDEFNFQFIENKKEEIYKEFNNILNSTSGYITYNDKLKFRYKYKTDYFDFYSSLDFESLIDEQNAYVIEEQKVDISKEFKEIMNSYQGFIKDSTRDTFKSKYKTDYFDFYSSLEFDNLIDEHNKNVVKEERIKVLDKIKNNLGISQGYISYSQRDDLKLNIDEDILDVDELIDYYNERYIEKQTIFDRTFFDDINGIRLDNDQIRAVLTDDDNTQIVAGAGTGKTLTIQAKVKYLIEKQNVSPSDILCISFSKSAKDDLKNKLIKTLGNDIVDVRTFHSIGYRILNINGLNREVPADEIKNLINNYFKEALVDNEDMIKKVIDFFAYYYNIFHINDTHFEFETIRSKLHKLDEYEEFLKEYLKVDNVGEENEYMKSFAELNLANFLFIHNIDYKHSQVLKLKSKIHDKYLNNYFNYLFGTEFIDVPFDIKKEFINKIDEEFDCKEIDYRPNFFLPDYDIYITLSSKKSNWREMLDDEHKEKWIKQLEIREKLNKNFKTNLLTIYDYGEDVDTFLNVIEDSLKNYNIQYDDIDYTNLFDLLIVEEKLPEYKSFIKTVDTFINLFKGNADNIDLEGNDISKFKFKQFHKQNDENYCNSVQKRNKFFLEIIEKIYETYTENIKDLIDFNDMINDATVALRKGAYIHNYKYIIVDEYQDTSHTRYKLLKEMQNSTGAKVVVVGDDWQSIYGFTGCDVGLFSDFDKYFENPKMVKIRNTRRNSQALINVAGEFIQKNKKQIPKKLSSDDHLTENPIKLVGCMSKAENVLSLMYILNEISQIKSNAKILILGRNNKDIYDISCKEIFTTNKEDDFTEVVYEGKPDLKIEFRSVHKSKGLQADYVIILNLTDKLNGFPNKMENDPILDFVKIETDENIDYPEERRLFYVALTRTENDVFLFHNEKRPSIFIDEIIHKKDVQSLNFKFSNEDIIRVNSLLEKPFEVIGTDNICPNCNVGYVNLIINNEKGTSYFRCSNFCGWDGGPYHNSDFSDKERAIKLSDLKYAKVCDCGGMKVVKSRRLEPEKKFLGCNFYETRGCAGENLPISYYYVDENIYNVEKTEHDVYYLHDYVPKEKRNKFNSKINKISKFILDYKNGEEYTFSLFTHQLMKTITFVSNKEMNSDINKMVILAVPPSKVSKKNKSTIKKSIDIFERWCSIKMTESQFGLYKKIINGKDLLERIKDVPTAHLGEGRATCEEHVQSIKCNDDDILDEKDVIYVILDDITTTGNSMTACKQILINNGVCKENIYTFAIGATVREKHGR